MSTVSLSSKVPYLVGQYLVDALTKKGQRPTFYPGLLTSDALVAELWVLVSGYGGLIDEWH